MEPKIGVIDSPAMEESPHKGKTGLQRIVNATRYSISGLAAAAKNEDAFRMELLAAAVLVPLALWIGPTGVGKALLVELLNSAVEATVDRISLEEHSLAKRAKDIGSAAVMLSLANAAVVWVLVLLA
jgi:diacylglycerol kinase (ATP)